MFIPVISLKPHFLSIVHVCLSFSLPSFSLWPQGSEYFQQGDYDSALLYYGITCKELNRTAEVGRARTYLRATVTMALCLECTLKFRCSPDIVHVNGITNSLSVIPPPSVITPMKAAMLLLYSRLYSSSANFCYFHEQHHGFRTTEIYTVRIGPTYYAIHI